MNVSFGEKIIYQSSTLSVGEFWGKVDAERKGYGKSNGGNVALIGLVNKGSVKRIGLLTGDDAKFYFSNNRIVNPHNELILNESFVKNANTINLNA